MVHLNNAVAATGSFARALPGTTVGGTNSTGPIPFSGVFHSLLSQTKELSSKAEDAVTGLLSGQGVEIHDVMIAQQKASVAFELALQVRNKAVSAYQQMMGMQF